MGRVIAIDGPSGAGKSTVSRRVAECLGFSFLDTGALYRAAALYLHRKRLTADSSEEALRSTLEGTEVVFRKGSVFLNGEDVSGAIRTPEAGHYASVFSARKAVREYLFQVQRDAALHGDIVAEGRDMTTVVFPDAWKKFYLDASEDGRAWRRYQQLKEKGIEISMEEALRDVRERDLRDSQRDIAPLRRAEDALYIDTTNMSLDEVIACILSSLKQ
ncbi:MAG: (d)CMP kinase [Alphaproteobacteria bacterium]|uniref:Cytidylate kinase n=1 Tax=Candidatus Nitrobium versatile TaxID=2884831 RepID=A0A953JBZ6_9BACT|nr:(d)CMP kinase [Candidatus Nitrobium versatile]